MKDARPSDRPEAPVVLKPQFQAYADSLIEADEGRVETSPRVRSSAVVRRPGRIWLGGGLLVSCVIMATWANAVLQPRDSEGHARATSISARPAVAELVAELPLPVHERASLLQAEAAASASDQWSTVAVRSGETLGHVFARMGLSSAQMHQILESCEHTKRLNRLMPGQELDFEIEDARVQRLRFMVGDNLEVQVQHDGERYVSSTKEVALERRVRDASGSIHRSLFLDGERAGLSDALIIELAQVFAWDIDFALDIRAGDRFSVIFEEIYRDGEKLRDGNILAAAFVNNGKRFDAVRMVHEDGKAEYFGSEGRNLKQAFMRTPLKFSRISSGFSLSRRHPILGVMRAHRGVDYAAPTGTPIRATGDGKITFRGAKSGYGNTIVVDHRGGYQTLYAHLSRFEPKARHGQRVRQGEVIGYVGMTGLATAPHLHYEFRINGVHRNPLTVDLPKADPLRGAELARFQAESSAVLARLAMIESSGRVAGN